MNYLVNIIRFKNEKLAYFFSLNKYINFFKFAQVCKMSTCKPPECVRGMRTLDKSKFTGTFNVPILNLKDTYVSDVMPHIKKYCLKMRHMKAIQNRNNEKYILLNPKILAWTDIEQVVRDSLAKVFVTEDNFSNTQLTINYDNYYADEIFKAVFPNTGEGFSSFSQVGHIIHLNLREHLLEYKSIIAQVLLDKVPRARTVVNKIDAIDNTYRNFEMEKLCGEDDMLVTIKENYCEFQFDFSKVYWNPRLSTEHERIVKTLTAGDVLFDVFAGVGPFAVPAAKKGCTVYANDLNPESFKWLNHNTKKNKVKNGNLYTYNKDGHQFIQEDLKVNLIKHINESNVIIVMNLPALAVEFLKNFCKMYSESELPNIVNPPILHVYCFAKGEDCISITKKTVTEHFGFDIEHKIINIFRVRTVSNFKEMMRVTIKLDKDVLVGRDGGKRKVDYVLESNSNCKKSCNGEEKSKANQKCN